MKKIVTLLLIALTISLCFGMFTFAEDEPELVKLDELNPSTVVEQKYHVSSSNVVEYADVICVDVGWVVKEVVVSYGVKRTWDPENLQWIETNLEEKLTIADNDVYFYVGNRSSVTITAKLSFTVASGLENICTGVTYEEDVNSINIGSVVDPDDHSISIDGIPSYGFKATVNFADGAFTNKDVETTKLGTYTLTISKTKSSTD